MLLNTNCQNIQKYSCKIFPLFHLMKDHPKYQQKRGLKSGVDFLNKMPSGTWGGLISENGLGSAHTSKVSTNDD